MVEDIYQICNECGEDKLFDSKDDISCHDCKMSRMEKRLFQEKLNPPRKPVEEEPESESESEPVKAKLEYKNTKKTQVTEKSSKEEIKMKRNTEGKTKCPGCGVVKDNSEFAKYKRKCNDCLAGSQEEKPTRKYTRHSKPSIMSRETYQSSTTPSPLVEIKLPRDMACDMLTSMLKSKGVLPDGFKVTEDNGN